MKFIKLLSLGTLLVSSIAANATVCGTNGNITSVIPSRGDVGIAMDVDLNLLQGADGTPCSCDHNMLWIDINSEGGKSMYSAALAAKLASKQVYVTIQDGRGQGLPTNNSITYRYWATCEIMALEVK